MMRLNGKSVALAAFLLWEAWWAYVFASAPDPDSKMDSVFAILMAVVLPLLIGGAAGLILFARRATRPRH